MRPQTRMFYDFWENCLPNRALLKSGNILRRWLVLLIVGASLASGPAFATSYDPALMRFQSLCTVVEIPASEIEPIDRKLVDALAFGHFQSQLRQSGFEFPAEHGRQCFPGKVGSPAAARQLSLRFNVVAARGPGNTPPAAISITVHSFHAGTDTSPIGWPTQILFCDDATKFHECLAQSASVYFEKNVIPVLLKVKSIREQFK